MRPFIILSAMAAIPLAVSCSRQPKIIYDIPAVTYPETRTTGQTDTYFGTPVADPYRWLENDTATETEAWVTAQNAVTNGFLEKIPFREKVRSRLKELYNYARITNLVQAGDVVLYAKNNGLQNQPVIYKQQAGSDSATLFLDPNTLSDDGTVAVNLGAVSRDHAWLSYSIAAAGSDWEEIRIREISTGKDLPEVLKNVKFAAVSWYRDGFFYSRFPEPPKGKALQELNKNQRVYYHRLNTPQEKDLLVYEDNEHPLRYNNVTVSDDEQYLFLYVAEGTDGFECHYKKADLKKGGFTPLFTGFKHKSTVVDHQNGLFYVITDINAPNYRLVAIDPAKPGEAGWQTVITESKHLLESVSATGGKLIAQTLEDVVSHLYVYNFDGTREKEISLPATGTATVATAGKSEPRLFFTFNSFTYPLTWYAYDVEKGETTPFFSPEVKFNPADYEVKQVFYQGKDSTCIPLFLVYRKDLVKDGRNPALLYGYGGFNISETPSFSSSVMALVDLGVVYAHACIRGGGEYGETWHQGGMLEKKQHVFDDFIAAAEYLIAEKYTSSDKLGINGGSNGGLLVGACMTQRPELFKVAIPEVGVMDMLRYQKFTVGFGWVPEFGSSDDSTQFAWLYAYSPLHNLKKGVKYPATLITTGDHDDRVVPAHSFKFAATLQAAQAGPDPVLIRIETRAGHSAGKPISKVIEEDTDKWSFFLYNTQTAVESD